MKGQGIVKLSCYFWLDPHVRIVGKPNDVKKAKERILSVLDSRVSKFFISTWLCSISLKKFFVKIIFKQGSRVTLKMDISYTDHSFIIGREGNNIKKIMADTSTHIHFPDSNRSNPNEKSNQVSLCGNLDGVEKARHAVRVSISYLNLSPPMTVQNRWHDFFLFFLPYSIAFYSIDHFIWTTSTGWNHSR